MEEVPLPISIHYNFENTLTGTGTHMTSIKYNFSRHIYIYIYIFLFVGPDLLGVGQYYVLLEAGNSFPSIQFTAISYKCMKLFLAYLLIYPAFEVVYFFAKKKIFILTLNNALFVS